MSRVQGMREEEDRITTKKAGKRPYKKNEKLVALRIKYDALKEVHSSLSEEVAQLSKDIAHLKEKREWIIQRTQSYLGFNDSPLSPKREMFCREYLACLEATEAYIRAYSRSGDWHPRYIKWKAHRLLHAQEIQDRLEELRRPILEKLIVSADKTLKRLMQGQEFDIRGLYHEDGRMKQPHELDEDTAKAVVGTRHDKEGNLIGYQVIDVKGCAELIGKHLKLWTDKVETEMKAEVKAEISGPGFPPEPGSIQEWEEQMKEYLEKKQEEQSESA